MKKPKERISVLAAMTTFPCTIEQDKPLSEVRKIIEQHGSRYIAVTEAGKLIGVVTSRDVNLAIALSEDPMADSKILVSDVCTLNPYIVGTSEKLDKVAAYMAQTNKQAALVVKDDKLVGVFTSSDACRILAESIRGETSDDIPDETA